MIITEFLNDKVCTGIIKEVILGSEIIMADNIAQYLHLDNPKFYWDVGEDFPCVAPPFPLMTIAAKIPNLSNKDGVIEWHPSLDTVNVIEAHNPSPSDENSKWELCISSFAKFRIDTHKLGYIHIETIFLKLDGEGKIILDKTGIKYTVSGWINPIFNDLNGEWQGPVLLPLLTLSFMNCKNVTLHSVCPSERLNHALLKRGRTPHLTYKVLDIHPMKRILATEGRISEVGLQKALHICRGHFKNFDNRPLFGKLRGQYWWDAHVRGDIKSGVVIKDYNVLAEVK